MKKYIIPFIIGSLFFATFAYSAPSIIYQRTIIPERDNAFDLGTSTQKWRNIYGTTLYGNGSNLTGIATLGSLSATSPLAYNSSTGNFYVSSGYEIPTTASTTAWEGKLSTTTAASTYVPYAGATGSVNLGLFNLTAATGTFTGNLHIPTITNSILATDGSGLVVATTTTGITSLGGLTGATQTFATSTGTNFTEISNGTTHTFYFPSFLDGFISTSTAYTALGFANNVSYHNATSSIKSDLSLGDLAFRSTDATGITSLGSQTGATQTFSTTTASASIAITSSANNHAISIGRNLDSFNTVATTTGNLPVASSTGGWFGLPIGTVGKLLMASSTQYGMSWERNYKYVDWTLEHPSSFEDVRIHTFPVTSTITMIYSNNKMSGDTVTYNLCFDTNRSYSSTTCPYLAFSAYQPVTNYYTTPSSTTSFATSTVPAGGQMRFLTSGTASSTEFDMTIQYYEN